MASPPDRVRPYRGGVLAGLLASVPFLGPALAAACLSCVGFGGAAVAGASLSIPIAPLVLAGVGFLALSWWRSVRRARQTCGPAECKRLERRLPLMLAVSALATFLLMRLVALPLMVRGLIDLGNAFSHRPSLP